MLNTELKLTYGINAPYCTLPGKRVFARINGEDLQEWCTKLMMFNGREFVLWPNK
jgi:hypothetical protein